MWALDWKKDWKWLKRKYIFIYRNILSLKIVWADKHHNKKTSWSWNVQPSMFEVTLKQLKLDIMFLHQFKRNTKPPFPPKKKTNKKKGKKKNWYCFHKLKVNQLSTSNLLRSLWSLPLCLSDQSMLLALRVIVALLYVF